MFAFERIAEEKIREAIAAGEFDHLPGKGKPLVLDEPLGLRPEDRLAYMILKNSGFLPEYLEWRKELEKSLNELQHFHQHCRQRLGKILARMQILPHAISNDFAPRKRTPWLRPFVSLREKREQNSTLGRGKEVGRQIQVLRQTYIDERKWLRRRLIELTDRLDAAARQLQQALIEKEIRDHRPIAFLLEMRCFSSREFRVQFDHEFPLAPWENQHAPL
jgi:hypothetical protein